MSSKTLFASIRGKLAPATDTVNEHFAPAYAFTPKHVLAQFAATGCMNSTLYATAEAQLANVLELSNRVEPEFVARTAIYAHETGFMKDMPALLCAVLSVRNPQLLAVVFDRVI